MKTICLWTFCDWTLLLQEQSLRLMHQLTVPPWLLTFALVIGLICFNRKENNGFFFVCIRLVVSMIWKRAREKQLDKFGAIDTARRNRSPNHKWNKWNDRNPDIYFDYNIFHSGHLQNYPITFSEIWPCIDIGYWYTLTKHKQGTDIAMSAREKHFHYNYE